MTKSLVNAYVYYTKNPSHVRGISLISLWKMPALSPWSQHQKYSPYPRLAPSTPLKVAISYLGHNDAAAFGFSKFHLASSFTHAFARILRTPSMYSACRQTFWTNEFPVRIRDSICHCAFTVRALLRHAARFFLSLDTIYDPPPTYSARLARAALTRDRYIHFGFRRYISGVSGEAYIYICDFSSFSSSELARPPIYSI